MPSLLLRLSNEEELVFNFTFVARQSRNNLQGPTAATTPDGEPVDTVINGLTFAYASNNKDLDNLVTREFHANPNLHKNSNVELVGDYATNGSSSVQFHWSWKWKPPKTTEDRGGGWRNCCTFVEYDQRAHRLNTLASFSFWVHNIQRGMISPQFPSPSYELTVPPRLRVPSSQSVLSSSVSEADHQELRDLPSPIDTMDSGATLTQVSTKDTVKVDVSCQRPGEDMSAVDDGPLFRATMKALEQKTGSMRQRMKKVLRAAEAAQATQVECNSAVGAFMAALKEAAASNTTAIQPALEHYFEKIAKQILDYEKLNSVHLQKIIIDPLSRLYNIDIKQAESKKKDFDDESKDYYAYLSRYLGQRQDSLKEKKRVESDSKYLSKRRNFELKRFDYSSFMQDLHGGRKEQEVLSHLTKFADTQARAYLDTAKRIEEMIPQLEALSREVNEADKEFQIQRTEREEKRRTLEKSSQSYPEHEPNPSSAVPTPTSNANGSHVTDAELARADSTGRNGSLSYNSSVSSQHGNSLSAPGIGNGFSTSPGSRPSSGMFASPGDRFKGIRDLEEKDHSASANEKAESQLRKEGLLWALSKPGSHVDPKGLNKQAWHK